MLIHYVKLRDINMTEQRRWACFTVGNNCWNDDEKYKRNNGSKSKRQKERETKGRKTFML